MNLANNYRDILLKYLKRILPSNNKLPSSYHNLKKDVDEYRYQKYKVCVDCGDKIVDNKCPNCVISGSTPKQVDASIFDLESQLIEIYTRNKEEIVKYKGRFYLKYIQLNNLCIILLFV
jgi:hypothetical protein